MTETWQDPRGRLRATRTLGTSAPPRLRDGAHPIARCALVAHEDRGHQRIVAPGDYPGLASKGYER